MRFLVVGLGSMGKRRIRNLTRIKAGEIIGFDPRQDRRDEAHTKYGVATVSTLEEGMAKNPDAFVISTPPDLHTPFMLEAARNGKHFFVEASVLDEGFSEIEKHAKAKGTVAAPSCTLRFHPAIQTIKKFVDDGSIGKPLSFTYHSGQWLPDWHPWEDYRHFYVAKKKTGACREIVPFELAWLTWIFGPVTRLAAQRAKMTSLETEIDDIYQLQMRFQNGGMGQLQVDVIARQPFRNFRMLTEDAVVDWDYMAKKVRVYRASEKKGGAKGEWKEYDDPAPITEPGYVAAENMYIAEMQQYVDAIAGKSPWPYSIGDDHRVLRTLYASEQASDASTVVTF